MNDPEHVTNIEASAVRIQATFLPATTLLPTEVTIELSASATYPGTKSVVAELVDQCVGALFNHVLRYRQSMESVAGDPQQRAEPARPSDLDIVRTVAERDGVRLGPVTAGGR
jgi:hypothetical protein